MNLTDLVKNCKRIGISGHENPDGDCAGSCCGTALYLRKVFPDAQVDIYLEPMQECLSRNIPGSDTIIHDVNGNTYNPNKYDAFIVLDSIPERIGEPEKLYREAAVKINIDHHMTNPGSLEAQCYIDGHASSACELVYDLIKKEQIDADIAKALYVGMVTDTGVFQYSNTAESTMRAAGHLMSYGFDHSAVIREVFFERTFLQARILGAALSGAETALSGKYIFCCFDREMMEKLGAERKDLDGISAQLLLTEGASLFGGGGHVHAAGCTISSGIGEAMKAIRDEFEGQLRNAGVI